MKRYLALALVVLCFLLIVGCGGPAGTPAPMENGLSQSQAAEIPGDLHMEPDWGITLTAEDVSPTGLTLVCAQSGGQLTGEPYTGSYYLLELRSGETWTAVEMLPQEHTVAWTLAAWGVPVEGETEWEVDWQWLYGELPAGAYRIGKEFMDFRGSGDFDEAMFYAEFEIE